MQAARRSILPPNATPLERAFDAAIPQWDALADQAEPAALRNNDSVLPWIAAHWQLGQFDRYFEDPRELLANGLPWLRERGSAAAVKRAMGWLGYSGVRIEEDGARLHINPGRSVTIADLQLLAHVVRGSIPLHVQFYRVFYRYDLRRIRLDNRPLLDSGMLDSDSGVPVDVGDGTVLASQGEFFSSVAQRPRHASLRNLTSIIWEHTTRRRDSMRLDAWRLDSHIRRKLGLVGNDMRTSVAQQYLRKPTLVAGSVSQISTAQKRTGVPKVQQTHSFVSTVPRTIANRTWATGTWDGHAWQVSEIITKHTEVPAP